MFIPKSKPHEKTHEDMKLKDSFTLLSWNVHKENLELDFQRRLEKFLNRYKIDFLLFQEYKMDKSNLILPKEYNIATAPNIETKSNFYGLLTASKSTIEKKLINLSSSKEFYLATKKANLATHHFFADGEELVVVNLHAINFVGAKNFIKELEKLQEFLSLHSCPVIVSGDFNNWSKKRFDALMELERSLGFRQAAVENSKYIKHFFNKPIEHLFYKGIELVEARAFDTKKMSDHTPIFATFKQLK
jgi:endonuclease/exonuclease/phosphatase (EEP) superfamily protein YafD